MRRRQIWLILSLAAGIAIGPSGAHASESLLGFWAVGLGDSGISTEFSLFNILPEQLRIDLTFFDDAEHTINILDTALTPFERKHFDVKTLVEGTNASAGLFLVTSPTADALRGTVIQGFDPGGGVDGIPLLLDQNGRITSARGLTGSPMRRLDEAVEILTAPLGLTTLLPAPGDGFQTFLVFTNVGTSDQSIEIKFYADEEVFLGSCGLTMSSFDLVIVRPGLPAMGNHCFVNLSPALVAPDRTTARWAARILTVPRNKVLLGEVFVINTRTSEAFVSEIR